MYAAFFGGFLMHDASAVVDWVPIGLPDGGGAPAFVDVSPNNADMFYVFDGDGTYQYGDLIDETNPQIFNIPNNVPFQSIGGDDTLNIFGTVYDAPPSDPITPGIQVLDGGGFPQECSLKINGDIILDATLADMFINVEEKTILEPFFLPPDDPDGLELGCSQIYFETAENTFITVCLFDSLIIRGTTNKEITDDYIFQDMIVTFAGPGTVEFQLTNGTSVWFTGDVDDAEYDIGNGLFQNGLELNPDTGLFEWQTLNNNAGGCKVFVLMDQTQADLDAGVNKVVFKRKDLSVDEDLHCTVGVGPNSVFTYLHDDVTGEVNPDFLDGFGCVAFDVSNPGIGRLILFIQGAYIKNFDPIVPDAVMLDDPNGDPADPANQIYPEVDIDGFPLFDFGQLVAKFPFNDGAFIVAGHFVESFDPEIISGCDINNPLQPFDPGYDWSLPAGVRAICKVCDDMSYMNRSNAPDPYITSKDTRRGLMVLNDCQNHGKLASDPYWDLYNSDDFDGPFYAYSNIDNNLFLTRHGCVVGVNGKLDIYHNTFMDYAAGAVNQVDPVAEIDVDFDTSIIKKRNPSALIIDGLDPALFVTGNPFDGDFTSEFIAADPFINQFPTKAEMCLRGDGTLYLRESASSFDGYMFNLWDDIYFNDSWCQPPFFLVFLADHGPDGILPYLYTYYEGIPDFAEADVEFLTTVGLGTYDGFSLSTNFDTVIEGEGEHVLDVEGCWKVNGLVNTSAVDKATGLARVYADGDVGGKGADLSSNEFNDRTGVMCVASLFLDHRGCEIDEFGTQIVRPLPGDDTTEYNRYNSGTMFFNNYMDLCNCTLRHSDVTKFVDCLPLFSEPGITGGERLFFTEEFWGPGDVDVEFIESSPNRYRFPEIGLTNSMLDLQESLNASGVRFVVKDILGSPDRTGDNCSHIRFNDHGDALDTLLTGMGRVFLCGSTFNLMADDRISDPLDPDAGLFQEASSNYATESCYFNVFKNNVPVSETPDDSSRATLKLINGDQFLAGVPASEWPFQRAHHFFFFAIPDDPGASCHMTIGWNEITGDARAFPGNFPYIGEPVVELLPDVPAVPFDLDGLKTPKSTVSVDGSIMCFGSFDSAGFGPDVPVSTIDDSGTVYVSHGGKLTITRPDTDLSPFDRNSVPYQCVCATTIAQRIWNDYDAAGTDRVLQLSGCVDLPHDQVKFDTKYAVQPVGITADMLDARKVATRGYVRLSFENPERDPLRDATGAEEVNIGWFFDDQGTHRQFLKSPLAHKTTPFARYMTRATESVNAPFDAKVGADTADVDLESLLFIGPGDQVVQMRVAGATMSDPFLLDISGHPTEPIAGCVREFVSLRSTRDSFKDRHVSEGDHAVLFGENGGRAGLGTRHWNEHSHDAWNRLGKDHVTVCPLGDMIVEVNNDLIVTDRLALIASTQFGKNADQRLTFYSACEREIRITKGAELDLSSFGKDAEGNPLEHLQQIVFAGKVKLVVEDGAIIRLSDVARTSNGNGVVLYFNDDSRLVFEGLENRASIPRNLSAEQSQARRTKLMGNGQIWINKNARMQILGNADVGVQSDQLSPNTDINLSVRRQGVVEIGNALQSGGSFSVGNFADQNLRSVRSRETGDSPCSIVFVLTLGGGDNEEGQPTFHIDREGFCGWAAGLVNKPTGVPNGSADPALNPVLDANGQAEVDVNGNPVFTPAEDAWEAMPLHNVAMVKLELADGLFEHKQTFDGSSNKASLMMFSKSMNPENLEDEDPAMIATVFEMDVNGREELSMIGGGNIMQIPCVPNPDTVNGCYPVCIWDYQGAINQVVVDEETDETDNVTVGIMASNRQTAQRDVTNVEGDVENLQPYDASGKTVMGDVDAACSFVMVQDLQSQKAPMANFASTKDGRDRVSYVNAVSVKYDTVEGGQIAREEDPNLVISVNSKESAQESGTVAVNLTPDNQVDEYVTN